MAAGNRRHERGRHPSAGPCPWNAYGYDGKPGSLDGLELINAVNARVSDTNVRALHVLAPACLHGPQHTNAAVGVGGHSVLASGPVSFGDAGAPGQGEAGDEGITVTVDA